MGLLWHFSFLISFPYLPRYLAPGKLARLEHRGRTDLPSWQLRPTVHNSGVYKGKNCSCNMASHHITWNGYETRRTSNLRCGV
ncbi:hypothetical protein FJTKL_14795 [Diaporthe vaccinii]|uniref:Secreted protein n=1 Tax=Diaporthe vaccinii TaxID=105482 RepID=A0ABR4F814_9PEZI